MTPVLKVMLLADVLSPALPNGGILPSDVDLTHPSIGCIFPHPSYFRSIFSLQCFCGALSNTLQMSLSSTLSLFALLKK